MIASLTGQVARVTAEYAVFDVAGVGYQAKATPATLASLRLGEQAHVKTSLVVREDSMSLFAFADDDERDIFEVVQGVSGIGPRIALAILAVLTPDGLRRAVHSEDAKAISRVPGIGPKTAARVLLELSGRLAPPVPDTAGTGQGDGQVSDQQISNDARSHVVNALLSLGYQAKVADAAVEAYLDRSQLGPLSAQDVPEILRGVLRSMAMRR